MNLSTGRVGLLGNWDAVAFDEVSGLQMSDGTVVNMLKDYMESGSFARGKEEVPAEASVVLVGNTSRPHSDLVREAHLFADLPPTMIDVAFLDRLHYYLPGWEVPKLESRLFTSHFGFVSDYFAEALRQLRKQSFVRAIDSDFGLGSHLSARDEKAVRKTVSGLLKILHPHGEWTRRRATRIPGVCARRAPPREGAAQEAGGPRLRQDRVSATSSATPATSTGWESPSSQTTSAPISMPRPREPRRARRQCHRDSQPSQHRPRR